jgi:serine/alanine adding enzyme
MAYRVTDSVAPSDWDSYVVSNPNACLYHLSGWGRVIQKTYGHKVYSIAAYESAGNSKLACLLSLVHLKHPVFGKSLVSIPFFDMGGILSDTAEGEQQLLERALDLAGQLGASLELRHTRPLSVEAENCSTRSHKVRMLLDLPGSSEALMQGFKSKLRSQINRATKDGLTATSGGAELVDEFYRVFLENMRDLGSPVHSKALIQKVMAEFRDKARIFTVRKDSEPIAASLTVGFKDILENPWASSLRRFSRFSPNMLLYWSMLQYAADNGYSRFDFGRSTPGEGTYKFKEQWGAHPEPLYWHTISPGKQAANRDHDVRKSFQMAEAVWKRLPIVVTGWIGPSIRKYISL